MSSFLDLNTLSEMDVALLSDLNASEDSSLYPENTRKMALNRAYRKAAALYRWPALEDSKKTTTGADQDYYDVPTTWRPDSVWRVEIDGVPYGNAPDFSPTPFNDFINWKADSANTTSTEKKWAVQWRRYFVTPTPTAAALVIKIWGQKNVTSLSADADTTIFSSNMPDCNEAVVLEAGAILKNKGEDKQAGQMMSTEAKVILTVAFNKIKQEQSKVDKEMPQFYVPDYFSNRRSSHPVGNFNLN